MTTAWRARPQPLTRKSGCCSYKEELYVHAFGGGCYSQRLLHSLACSHSVKGKWLNVSVHAIVEKRVWRPYEETREKGNARPGNRKLQSRDQPCFYYYYHCRCVKHTASSMQRPLFICHNNKLRGKQLGERAKDCYLI